MQQEITPTFTENELLELLAVLDDAIWTRVIAGNECVGPLGKRGPGRSHVHVEGH
ncbi:hypothetical protein PI124_g13566 [Phytophthora idaei]|nr:hypothetical protein PI124_g13566 [Phytophthora idaei]